MLCIYNILINYIISIIAIPWSSLIIVIVYPPVWCSLFRHSHGLCSLTSSKIWRHHCHWSCLARDCSVKSNTPTFIRFPTFVLLFPLPTLPTLPTPLGPLAPLALKKSIASRQSENLATFGAMAAIAGNGAAGAAGNVLRVSSTVFGQICLKVSQTHAGISRFDLSWSVYHYCLPCTPKDKLSPNTIWSTWLSRFWWLDVVTIHVNTYRL